MKRKGNNRKKEKKICIWFTGIPHIKDPVRVKLAYRSEPKKEGEKERENGNSREINRQLPGFRDCQT